jgi:hypothetical protein
MLNIFLDTNIYLNFYRLSSDDIEKLENLIFLIKDTEDIKLFITTHSIDEFYRNRDNQIAELLKILGNIWSWWLNLPTFCKKYNEYDTLKDVHKDLLTKRKNLEAKILNDINSFSLPPDKIIEELFWVAKTIQVTDDIVNKARLRTELWNPPWKKWSLWDAINWICLLEQIPDDEELYFVWIDGDFKSTLDKNRMNTFLKNEWEKSKLLSTIKYYENLSSFIKENFPNLWELDEYKKEKQIEKLLLSWSFNRSRQVLESLRKIWNFSDYQINKIVESSLSNNQVFMAHEYSPELVWEVLAEIVKWKHDIINPKFYDDFCKTFNINQEIFYVTDKNWEYFELPF